MEKKIGKKSGGKGVKNPFENSHFLVFSCPTYILIIITKLKDQKHFFHIDLDAEFHADFDGVTEKLKNP